MMYWASHVPEKDDFGDTIKDVFFDAPTKHGPWALMTPTSWYAHRATERLGIGKGQRYVKQDDGRFLKMEG